MSDETKNDFGPAALVLALGLAFAAMFWAAGSKAHGAELDGGTVLKYDIAAHEVSVPCSDPARCALPWKVAIAMGVKPGPDEPPILMAYGVVKEGFKTEAACRGKKGLGDPVLKKLNAFVQVKLAKSLGIPPEAIIIFADCLDSTKAPPPKEEQAPAPKIVPEPRGEKL